MSIAKMNFVLFITATLTLCQIVQNGVGLEINPQERYGTVKFMRNMVKCQFITNIQNISFSIGENGTTYLITKTWDGSDTDTNISITFTAVENGTQRFILVEIEAPFFGNPEGPDPALNSTSDPYEGLWEYEVVEAFFLGANEEYLEMEFSPSGHYLLYYLVGVRNPTNQTLRIDPPEVSLSPDNSTWTGSAMIPVEYFPCATNKFNAYAIHIRPDDGENKTYMSLFPAAPGQFEQPDFHKLELFGDVSFDEQPNQEQRCDGSNDSGSSNSQITLSVLFCSILTSLFLGRTKNSMV